MNTETAPLHDPFVEAFPENKPFWEAAARGVFLVPRCDACSKVHWHPRAHCPFCHGAAVSWVQASGRGKVYSYTIVRRPNAPYVLAWVQIDEGPIMMTNVVDCELDAVRIDMPVKVNFRPTVQGRHAPVFRPA
jgi:uncharacterized OB-fold protein